MTSETTTIPLAPRSGWGWLAVSTVSRGYLVFVATLVVMALLPVLFGLSSSLVQSGSMQPHVDAGDVVLSQRVAPEDPPPIGFVVTFEAPAGSAVSGLMLHRVVRANPDGTLVTAGDANADVDSTPILPSAVISRARVLIPWIGLPPFWLRTGAWLPLGLWLLLTAAAVLIEATAVRPPRGVPPRPQQVDDPAAPDPDPVPPPRERFPALVQRVRGRALRPAVGLGILLAAGLAFAPLGGADASFSSRTSSRGNSWTTDGPATRLAFRTQPSGGSGGASWVSQPVVVAQDNTGRTISLSAALVTLTITTPAGAVLTCSANPQRAVSGVDAFTGCSITRAGTYTLTAASGALTAAVSAPFVITTGPASKLSFTTQPSGAAAGSPWAVQPQVTVQDAGGNTVTTSTLPLTLSLTTPAGATLTCTPNPRNAVSGIDTFVACKIDKAGTYTLTAASGSLSPARSVPFTITAVVNSLSCTDQVWMAVFSWGAPPQVPTTYTLYVNGIKVAATGADGWNSIVQLTSNNVPFSPSFPAGKASVEVRKVLTNGQEVTIGTGTALLGPQNQRTYQCG